MTSDNPTKTQPQTFEEWRKLQDGFYPFDIPNYPRRQERAAEMAFAAGIESQKVGLRTDSGYGCVVCGAPPWGPHRGRCVEIAKQMNAPEVPTAEIIRSWPLKPFWLWAVVVTFGWIPGFVLFVLLALEKRFG